MPNPRSLVHALHAHWHTVEALVRQSRDFSLFTEEQVIRSITRVSPQLRPDEQGAVLRALAHADILLPVARSSDWQLNELVLSFVRGLIREHDLGLASVLQARVSAIRDATESLNEGLQGGDIDRLRESARRLTELFRQISMQLDQDRHALLDMAEQAKRATSNTPITQRYRRVLEAFDQYVEPMNQMMDSGPAGTFYRHLEAAEQSLDLAAEQLSIQGAIHSHRMQLRQAAHQAKELRRFGRVVARQCADTLLPLRDELRQHNALTSAISTLLGRVRKRGLRHALSPGRPPSRQTPPQDTPTSPASPSGSTTGLQDSDQKTAPLPLWRNERGFRLHVGDEIREIMAAARHYVPQDIPFPQDDIASPEQLLEIVDESAIRAQLAADLPVESLLDWLHQHHGHLEDTTLLRIFHELQRDGQWHAEPDPQRSSTDLKHIRVTHHPHRITETAS